MEPHSVPDDRLDGELQRLVRAMREGDEPGAAGTIVTLGAEYAARCLEAGFDLPAALDRLVAALAAERVAVTGTLIDAVVQVYLSRDAAERAGESQRHQGNLSGLVSRLAALRRINQAATASLELDEMLQTVVREVGETMRADSCSIFLYQAASNTLVLRASVGLNPEATGRVTLPLGTGITGVAAATRRMLAVPDAATHPAYLAYPLIGDQLYTSQVSVPLALRSPDRLVGVLNILTLERREFDPGELAFLETAAGEMAIAIENARLYSATDAELQRRISQLSTLQHMSRIVASTLDLPTLLRLISEQTVTLTHATAVEIYRVPRGTQELRLELLSRFPEDSAQRLARLEEPVRGLVEDVVRSGSSIWRHLTQGDESLYVHALPMLTGRRAVGAICVFHPERPASETDSASLLYAFSDSAAIAIENAELYEEARRGFTRASTLLQEMHHRVRNNLQTVAALLSMQARHGGEAEWATPLREAVSRIQSIAAIHDVLSGGNLRETTIDTIAKHVADEASINLVDPGLKVTFRIHPSDVHVTSREATVLALLINEFIANAIMHGFSGRSSGRIEIRATRDDGGALLEVADDGLGLPAEFSAVTRGGLGLQIARTLVEVDLHGSLELVPRPNGGTIVRVRFTPATQDPAD